MFSNTVCHLVGDILTPGGFTRGQLDINAQHIAAITGESITDGEAGANGRAIILPGFIDLHVHGGGGHDVMQGGDAASMMARLHARHGTTSLLATTMTAPLADLEHACNGIGKAMRLPAGSGARILGVHLEGPFISPEKLGAQPDFHRPLDVAEILNLHDRAAIRLITLAPELAGVSSVLPQLIAAGFCVQLGHTAASYETCVEAMALGAQGFTHLFNAMSGLHHRAPGAVGAALAHADYAEIIPDLLHVHAGAIRTALRAIPGLYCVTDGTSATGMPDGDYLLGRQSVHKCLGGVRLADGTLAGSTLTMDQALRNLVSLGLSLSESSRRTSTIAAKHIGLYDRGELSVGNIADMAILDAQLKICRVITEGAEIDLKDA